MAASMKADATSLAQENVANMKDIDSMKLAFQSLCADEERVSSELDLLLEHQNVLESKMQTLHKMLPNLDIIQVDSQQLSGMISFTSTLAENVSSKVRQLDLAKSRVTSCMQRVEDILDLKFCTDGVQTALQNEDYEQASAHVHRFLSLDENVLRMTADATDGSSTLDTSFRLLHEAETKLKAIVHTKFDAAVHSADVASVERFFKIFPLLKLHDEGLQKFSKYLSAQMSEKAEQNLQTALAMGSSDKRANVLYADTITLLFEGIARVVEIHQPLVETYYGPGRMLTFLQILQKECDRQTRTILEHFKQNRQFDARVQQVQSSSAVYQKSSVEKLDPMELDSLLTELTLLNTRSELYLRFVKRRLVGDLETITDDEERQAEIKKIDQFLNESVLKRSMQELIGCYILMEEYFMREMLHKAVQMNVFDEGSTTSSMVDDTFYVVKKSVRRALGSSSIDGACAMLNHACSVLEQEFREVLYSNLRSGFPSGFDFAQAYNIVHSSIHHGKLQSADNEKAKTTFLFTLNNAEVSVEYIQTLKKNIESDITRAFNQASELEQAKLQTCLNELGAVSSHFKDVLTFGFSQLNSSAVKPRIKPLVDTFLATTHNLSEEDFTNFEANDPWVQNFIVNVDGLLTTFKSSLTLSNYDTLVSQVTTEVTTQLEKSVLKTAFNRLGGLQFDRELRALVAYLTSITTWTIRDKFARLTQMATILNLEKVMEILDYWGTNSGPLTWRLTPAEVRQVLTLRVDFRSDEIKRLKL